MLRALLTFIGFEDERMEVWTIPRPSIIVIEWTRDPLNERDKVEKVTLEEDTTRNVSIIVDLSIFIYGDIVVLNNNVVMMLYRFTPKQAGAIYIIDIVFAGRHFLF